MELLSFRWMSVLSNSRKEALEKAFGEHGNGLVRLCNCNMHGYLNKFIVKCNIDSCTE
jgi:hypothetical protein